MAKSVRIDRDQQLPLSSTSICCCCCCFRDVSAALLPFDMSWFCLGVLRKSKFNMIRHFTELFRITLPHGFYADGRGKDFVLSPSVATQQIMQKHDLRWGQKQDEFIMLYAREADTAPKLAQLDLPEVLRFFIQSTDPYFFNITKIPIFRSDAELLYFNNLTIEVDNDQAISLSQAAKVSKNDLLPVRASSFVFESPTGAILALHDVHNQVLVANDTQSTTEPTWIALGQTERPNTYRVNLQAFPPPRKIRFRTWGRPHLVVLFRGSRSKSS